MEVLWLGLGLKSERIENAESRLESSEWAESRLETEIWVESLLPEVNWSVVYSTFRYKYFSP